MTSDEVASQALVTTALIARKTVCLKTYTSLVLHNGSKRFCIQAGGADQSTIDLRL